MGTKRIAGALQQPLKPTPELCLVFKPATYRLHSVSKCRPQAAKLGQVALIISVLGYCSHQAACTPCQPAAACRWAVSAEWAVADPQCRLSVQPRRPLRVHNSRVVWGPLTQVLLGVLATACWARPCVWLLSSPKDTCPAKLILQAGQSTATSVATKVAHLPSSVDACTGKFGALFVSHKAVL